MKITLDVILIQFATCTDMTIYVIGPARLVATMCRHKLPRTVVTSLTLSNV